ncbi:helix-turn-helix domain-containing protein [Stappia taiwanensis]|uniref:Helix-turn-helix domain-containing protein n=1 Tax=Stappia taiwanensis TaxID=992267 RepID=A0A838XRM1_9HYPH|nr:IclR family transcriptional regulator C-terminal domain-containing protein [Stappia taiwanensis]MBA4613095.1 helix-turn-helix domain-containing protein [Stappia taiwanensis]GGF01254.1 transcriptional regulator [Stappia taiwanensis]
MQEARATYRNVSSIGRGLKVLEALGELGWVKIGVLSEYAGIDRSSLYRIVNTLVELGYVARRSEDGAISLTEKIAQLADGLKDNDIVGQTVAPHLRALTRKVLWPCDFASLTSGALEIQYSTHRISPMSIHRSVVGKKRHLVRSALGRAILSAMTREELETALAIVQSLGGEDAADIANRPYLDWLIEETRGAGYAGSAGQADPKVGAIAAPVMGPESVVGAVNIIFFRSAMTPAEAAERYLDDLLGCVARIEAELRVNLERPSAT